MAAEKTYCIGDPVVISHTGRKGIVVGVWTSLSDRIQFNVRYSDLSETVHDFWFTPAELKPME
jgi:hypothetical protein